MTTKIRIPSELYIWKKTKTALNFGSSLFIICFPSLGRVHNFDPKGHL